MLDFNNTPDQIVLSSTPVARGWGNFSPIGNSLWEEAFRVSIGILDKGLPCPPHCPNWDIVSHCLTQKSGTPEAFEALGFEYAVNYLYQLYIAYS